MKANELRIGNYVEIFGVQKVISINSKKIKVESEKKDGSVTREKVPLFSASLKPIPLTEYWLLKFGFKWEILYQGFHNGSFKISEVYKKGYRFHISRDSFFVNSVHELQNLYFALTGQELKLASDSAQL